MHLLHSWREFADVERPEPISSPKSFPSPVSVCPRPYGRGGARTSYVWKRSDSLPAVLTGT